MEDMKFNNRLEQVQWYEQQQGWGPLTEEDKQALDEAVRMVITPFPQDCGTDIDSGGL